MIFLNLRPIKIEIKKSYVFIRQLLINKLYLSYLKSRQVFNQKIKKKIYPLNQKDQYLIIENSNSRLKNWVTYRIDHLLSNSIYKRFHTKDRKTKIIRIVVEKGIRSLKSLSIYFNTKNSYNLDEAKIQMTKREIGSFRDINHIDIPVKSQINHFSIKSKGSRISYQAINYSARRNIKTILIILDAVDADEFEKSSIYLDNLSKHKHYFNKAFAPSSVTSSSFASILTLKPFYHHCLGDYSSEILSGRLRCLSFENKTIPEILDQKLDYSCAFTSFKRTNPFYSYYRGFNFYENISSGNMFFPSAIDKFSYHLLNQYDIADNSQSIFGLVHDIGSHPPYHPHYIQEKKGVYKNNSYNYSLNLSLKKIDNLFNILSINNEIEKYNIIITADHSRNYAGFSIKKFNLSPSRLNVPIYFKPSIKSKYKTEFNLKNEFSILPLTYHLSSIFSSIYNIDIPHPCYAFKSIIWLSSCFSYPARKTIFNLGFDIIDQKYFILEISSEIINYNQLKKQNMPINIKYFDDNFNLSENANSIQVKRLTSSFNLYKSEFECFEPLTNMSIFYE